MADQIDVLTWEGRRPAWAAGALVTLPRDLAGAARRLDEHVAGTDAPWLLVWDPLLGDPDPAIVADLAADERADAWHAGLCLGLAGEPAEQDYIHPVWPLAHDGDPDRECVSWRVSLGALLVRTDVLRTLGGLDPAFEGPTGAGLELGRRLIDRGAVVRHTPRLVGGRGALPQPLTDHDRFAFLLRVFGRKWVRYAALRRVAARGQALRTVRSLLRAQASVAGHPRPVGIGEPLTRPEAPLPPDPRITVVLPTLGRYELLRPLLAQLRTQTIRPEQVLVVDQNDVDAREPSCYEGYDDIGLEVIWQEVRGQWVARNAAIARASGEYLAFLDDDSEIGPDFLERHLEALVRYHADLTTGASLAVVGAPVPESYARFRVADQWDSGNGMCHRRLLEREGLFDEQFDRQRRGDAEFGLRVQVHGGLVIHVPGAVRVHLKAAAGGLRTYGSWDGFRHRDRSSPLPLPSMLYYTKRYHSPRQVREDLLIGVSQSIVPYHLKRRASPGQWLGFVAAELIHLPSTARRISRSLRIANRMVAEGPRIPQLAPVSRPRQLNAAP